MRRCSEGEVRECAGSPLCKSSSPLGSNLLHTPANKHVHPYTQKHTQKERLHEEVKERSHPAGCSLTVLLLMLCQTPPTCKAACRFDIFTNNPLQFSQNFYMPWKHLPGLSGITSLVHTGEFPLNLSNSAILPSLASCAFYTLCCLLI